MSLSCVRLFATPWTIAYQAPPSMGFSRQGYWSELPFPSPSPEKVLSLCIWQFPEISPIKILLQCEISISPYHREYFHTHVLFNVCVNCILPPHGSVCAHVCVCAVCVPPLLWYDMPEYRLMCVCTSCLPVCNCSGDWRGQTWVDLIP